MINHDVLYQILSVWAEEEPSRMLHTLKKKLQMRGQVQQTLDNRPLEWMVEAGMVKKEESWKLYDGWKKVYNGSWIQCERPSDVNALCREYLYGLQWVLDYYTGQRPVNMLWSFSRLLPPLWTDLAKYLETFSYEPFETQMSDPIQPCEQLAMVLPIQSWHLIQEPSFRSLPSLLPQFWPESFGFFSVGRTRMWECEALVPMLTVERIRSAVKKKRDCCSSK
jgi:5'-3' exonuclease